MNKNNYEENPGLHIERVQKGSIAEECGLQKGDIIYKINDQDTYDELDLYYFNVFDNLTLEVKKTTGDIEIIEIEKSPEEELGIECQIDQNIKSCKNHCVFCFIDQLPKGLRKTLYIKDDDAKLSFLKGNYITLTNLSESEFEKICNWKTPVNISVHSTNPDLRAQMLGNKAAKNILQQLSRLKKASVPMKAQIVLVPDSNDKDLLNTLKDLASFYPELENVSVVPVGLTKHRKHLKKLRLFNKEEAKAVISEVEAFQKKMLEKIGTHFVYLADEFYLLAEEPIPDDTYYEDFAQIENGVGMVRNFLTELTAEDLKNHKRQDNKRRLLLTGELFFPILEEQLSQLKDKYQIQADVFKIKNHFFGETIDIAGLVTGQDILNNLKAHDIQSYDEILIPDTMLKNETDLFLDDLRISEIESELNKKIIVLPNDGGILLKHLVGVEKWQKQ